MHKGEEDEREGASGSVQVDSFLREVARAPRLEPSRDALAEPDLVGRTLLHFHVVERLGAGGMGVVYKALDEKLRRPVALKVLSGRLLADSRHRETLLREARSAAAVNHPNIAAIHEVHDGPELTFFVMELVDGETLRARLARDGALPVAEALRVALGIARGLARAHASSVVHRDLKCENVMLTKDGDVKLLDFGLATVKGAGEGASVAIAVGDVQAAGLAPTIPATSTPTPGGLVAGTPASMAPEQARGEATDPRTDVYGFGVVLYEMLAGQAPFGHRAKRPWEWGDETSPEWMPVRPLPELAPRAPREVLALVARCLTFAREKRPADGAALVQSLGGLPAVARRRARTAALLLISLTIAAVGTGAFLALRHRSIDPGATAPRPSVARASAAPTLRRLDFEPTLGFGSLSADGTRIAYFPREWRPSKVRVRTLATQVDDFIELPGSPEIGWALLRGEGAAERLLVVTHARALWSVRLDSHVATRIADSHVGLGLSMSADGRFVAWRRDDAEGRTPFVRWDATTGRIDALPADSETLVAELSPDGSLAAWVDSTGSAPAISVARVGDASPPTRIVLDRRFNLRQVTWIDADRLLLSTQVSGAAAGRLWQLRLDEHTLSRTGDPEPIASWSGFLVWGVKVHRALKQISLLGQVRPCPLLSGRVDPKTHQISDIRTLIDDEAENTPNAWTLDGRALLLSSDRSGHPAIYEKAVVEPSPALPVVVSANRTDWAQLAEGGSSLLYWEVRNDRPTALMRAPLEGSKAGPASVLFSAPDLLDPLSVHARVRCAPRSLTCLLQWSPSLDAAGWYRLDPRDGSRRRIEGLPVSAPSAEYSRHWDLSPDGREVAIAGKDAVDLFRLDEPVSLRRSIHVRRAEPAGGEGSPDLDAALWGLAFDAAGEGIFIGNGLRSGRIDYLANDGTQTEVRKGIDRGPDANAAGFALVVSPDGTRCAFSEMHSFESVWTVEDAFE